MKLYVASSWRNKYQPDVVEVLRRQGHEVYDFRHPAPGNDGFAWSQIDSAWQSWTPAQYREALRHPIARGGFGLDLGGMTGAEGCVLVLPCGRSAHLEAGWFMGRGLPVWILVPEPVEPELMYLLARGGAAALCLDIRELLEEIRNRSVCPCLGCDTGILSVRLGGLCGDVDETVRDCPNRSPEEAPFVCPGCHAISDEPHAAYCPDEAIRLQGEEEAEHAELDDNGEEAADG